MQIDPPPLRQLPPPPRRHSGGSQMDELTDSQLSTIPTAKRDEEEEGNSVVMIDLPKKGLKVKNGRSRPYYSRRCKRLSFLGTNINSLPDEIIFDILARVPAQDIFEAVMPICLKWYQMIRTRQFVNTHLQRSPYGILIKSYEATLRRYQLTFIALSRQGRTELTRLNYEPECELWYNSCNGLILESDFTDPYSLLITNPVTMQHFDLPLLFCTYLRSALAYASLSMEYKVVRVYYRENQWYCAILTVGVDESWRHVRTQHLSREAQKLFRVEPMTTEGFVHWAGRGSYILTLNVENEIIKEYLVPSLCSDDIFGYNYYYFPSVKYLSLFIPRLGWSWEVWEMKPETGEWTKLPGIELDDRKCKILEWCHRRIFRYVGYSDRMLTVVGWLEYKEVLFCRVSSGNVDEPRIYIAWNVRSKEIEFIEFNAGTQFYPVHRNSLVWLDGIGYS